eukprot:TRINITY_DN12012_c0_g2_i1.p1 TRINITY_DN12012_c0_g2~~TRINITY_DN12012_c0_g2_i1.p1  ORF type:complete len:228 (-),score=18.98 TRINITY_DN12012_c0_g2_i1:5-688(-)
MRSCKRSSRFVPSLESTKLCKFHAEGKCKRGESCTFAHSSEQIRDQPDFSKTRLCAAFKRVGRCTRGTDCKFAHGNDDRSLRFGGQALAANYNPAAASITSEPQTFGALSVDSSIHEQAIRPQIPERRTCGVIEQDDTCFVRKDSAHASSARSSSSTSNRCFEHGGVSRTQETSNTFPVKNTFIEFADEPRSSPRRSSSLPAHFERCVCRPAPVTDSIPSRLEDRTY